MKFKKTNERYCPENQAKNIAFQCEVSATKTDLETFIGSELDKSEDPDSDFEWTGHCITDQGRVMDCKIYNWIPNKRDSKILDGEKVYVWHVMLPLYQDGEIFLSAFSEKFKKKYAEKK